MTRFRDNLVIASAIAAGLMVSIVPAQATPLAPGGTVAATFVPNPVGAILADTGLQAFSFGSPLSTGTVREIVVEDAANPFGAGKLSFVYQVHDATGDVGRISGSSYAGFLPDVGVNVPLAPFFTSGTAIPITIDRSSGVGDVVGFNFTPMITPDAGSSDTSFELIVRTDASSFGTGSIGVIDGGGQTLFGFAPTALVPTPEPVSMLLIGGGLFALAGLRRFSRR